MMVWVVASEHPLDTHTWIAFPSVVCTETTAQLYFGSYVQIVTPNVSSHLIPQLWLGEQCGVSACGAREVAVDECHMILPPVVGKSREREAFHSHQVVLSPHGSQLHRQAAVTLGYTFVKYL